MEVVLSRERPDLEKATEEAFRERWPEFIFHHAVSREYPPRRTGMLFPASGDYVVPDALNLVQVDREADRVVYREENLWVEHRPAR
jgi:hypothetical protein